MMNENNESHEQDTSVVEILRKIQQQLVHLERKIDEIKAGAAHPPMPSFHKRPPFSRPGGSFRPPFRHHGSGRPNREFGHGREKESGHGEKRERFSRPSFHDQPERSPQGGFSHGGKKPFFRHRKGPR